MTPSAPCPDLFVLSESALRLQSRAGIRRTMRRRYRHRPHRAACLVQRLRRQFVGGQFRAGDLLMREGDPDLSLGRTGAKRAQFGHPGRPDRSALASGGDRPPGAQVMPDVAVRPCSISRTVRRMCPGGGVARPTGGRQRDLELMPGGYDASHPHSALTVRSPHEFTRDQTTTAECLVKRWQDYRPSGTAKYTKSIDLTRDWHSAPLKLVRASTSLNADSASIGRV